MNSVGFELATQEGY
ncbi:hypothetical protein C5167_043204 [Papaver somniferum]|uniref:Uncharacterized protein n=1 Tax=Papaver somniferum TaxID=3469 RepID=A0A4Y7L915_PAPSO|nr:hypothetical protein C5167_043204 [Papaver somniferum]